MNDEIRDNLIIILKLFKNKPQYLIKFLLENNAFNEDFLRKVFDSVELNRLRTLNEDEEEECEEDLFGDIPHFKSIDDMNQYFKNIISNGYSLDEDNIYEKLNVELRNTLVTQLRKAIAEERYEDAADIRDRMHQLNIPFDE
jgi:protein-arginine kinase activator protein McsA